MKTILPGLALAFGLTAPALAADAPLRAPAPFGSTASASMWTGFYAGISGGYGRGSAHQGTTTAAYQGLGIYYSDVNESLPANGGLIGATVGYNHQFGQVVAGLEADFSLTGMKSHGQAPDGNIWLPGDRANQTWSTTVNWLSTLRGRVGFTFDRFLVYATGGLALGGVSDRTRFDYDDGAGGGFSTSDRSSKTHVGWTLGAGVEAALTDRLTAKLEYLHVDLGTQTYRTDLGRILIHADARITADMVRAGLNYRF
ncbi:MAG: porin family protein [Rhizobiales bacterium]|nr:porin family protein [Hyphomicrobiales bacterium]